MSRNRRFRPSRALTGAAGAVALTGMLALSGCGAGQLAQTANQTSAVNGISAQQGEVLIRDARIAYPPNASTGVLYPAGSSAPLEVTLLNSAPVTDRLVGVSSPGAPAARIGGDPTMTQGIPLVAQVAAEGGVPADSRPITIELGGLVTPIRTGLSVPVTFTFERAGSIDLDVPIAAPPESAEPERADAESEAAGEAGSEAGGGDHAGAQSAEQEPAETPATPAPAGSEGGS
ncbi:MAG: hypothetical protein L0I76_12235 [Pseudonocardia sp.]|nr:hypothetical protein [Pseudonocardia sp.]